MQQRSRRDLLKAIAAASALRAVFPAIAAACAPTGPPTGGLSPTPSAARSPTPPATPSQMAAVIESFAVGLNESRAAATDRIRELRAPVADESALIASVDEITVAVAAMPAAIRVQDRPALAAQRARLDTSTGALLQRAALLDTRGIQVTARLREISVAIRQLGGRIPLQQVGAIVGVVSFVFEHLLALVPDAPVDADVVAEWLYGQLAEIITTDRYAVGDLRAITRDIARAATFGLKDPAAPNAKDASARIIGRLQVLQNNTPDVQRRARIAEVQAGFAEGWRPD